MNIPNHVKIDIALVNAVTYQHAFQLPRAQSFRITLSNGKTLAHLASASPETPIDLTNGKHPDTEIVRLEWESRLLYYVWLSCYIHLLTKLNGPNLW